MTDWFAPKDIVFNLEQVKWLLANLYDLICGTWPPEPKDSGYTDTIQRTRSYKAPFVKACDIAGELEARINKTGRDGHFLRTHYCDCVGVDRIAILSGLGISQVERRINSALWYCVGWRRKRISYKEFKARGHYRKVKA